MTYAGLDIGSRTIVLVEFDEGLKDYAILDTGPNPVDRCQRLLDGKTYRRVVATGYGRHLAAATLAARGGLRDQGLRGGSQASLPGLPHGHRRGRAGLQGDPPVRGRGRPEVRDERPLRRRHRPLPGGDGEGAGAGHRRSWATTP